MTAYLAHRTSAGERWDQLAHRYYGDVARQGELIAANRELFIAGMQVPVLLEAGLVLRIPIRDRETTSATTAAQLPPWKR